LRGLSRAHHRAADQSYIGAQLRQQFLRGFCRLLMAQLTEPRVIGFMPVFGGFAVPYEVDMHDRVVSISS
jgi:hypothetical protein